MIEANILDPEKVTDEEVEIGLRSYGLDPRQIGRRGSELASGLLERRRQAVSGDTETTNASSGD